MTFAEHDPASSFEIDRPMTRGVVWLTAVLALTVVTTPVAQAQTFTVLHNFTFAEDGAYPETGLAMDRAGNFYGTSRYGANGYGGVVFKLAHRGSGWVFNPLHNFVRSEGIVPAGLTVGRDGNIYGANQEGGIGSCNANAGCGTVFKLTPPPTSCRSVLCPWAATALYLFTGGSDGFDPLAGVIFDQAGNLYGTTNRGGNFSGGLCSDGCGVVYELTPSNGGWTQSVIHSFNGSDGDGPEGGLTFDSGGNLYGSANGGGMGYGLIFQLTPSGSGWTDNILYFFQGGLDGAGPIGSLIFDSSGNLYGATVVGGLDSCNGQCGTEFSLAPSNGAWVHTVLYLFTGSNGDAQPLAGLTMDAAGNLYGTTGGIGPSYGNVFKLTPSNGGWTYTSLHNFTGGADGGSPQSNVSIDANGNLYGTAQGGGSHGYGVVWEITP